MALSAKHLFASPRHMRSRKMQARHIRHVRALERKVFGPGRGRRPLGIGTQPSASTGAGLLVSHRLPRHHERRTKTAGQIAQLRRLSRGLPMKMNWKAIKGD